jgi:hypothetical protein
MIYLVDIRGSKCLQHEIGKSHMIINFLRLVEIPNLVHNLLILFRFSHLLSFFQLFFVIFSLRIRVFLKNFQIDYV